MAKDEPVRPSDERAKDILGRPLLTAEELEAMTEQERKEAVRGGVIDDLDLVPPAYVAKHRAHLEQIIARRDAEQSDGPVQPG